MSLLLGRAQSLAFLGVGLLNPGLPRTIGLTWSRTRGCQKIVAFILCLIFDWDIAGARLRTCVLPGVPLPNGLGARSVLVFVSIFQVNSTYVSSTMRVSGMYLLIAVSIEVSKNPQPDSEVVRTSSVISDMYVYPRIDLRYAY